MPFNLANRNYFVMSTSLQLLIHFPKPYLSIKDGKKAQSLAVQLTQKPSEIPKPGVIAVGVSVSLQQECYSHLAV